MIDRITKNEERLDKLSSNIKELEVALENFKTSKKDFDLLNKYYDSKNWIKDKACEPVLGSHSTRELLRIQYGTREKAWLVWNKCFRIDVLRAAEASAEYEVFYRLTDYYLCFLACCEGQRYYGIATPLYNYSYGPGISLQSLDFDGILRYMSGLNIFHQT